MAAVTDGVVLEIFRSIIHRAARTYQVVLLSFSAKNCLRDVPPRCLTWALPQSGDNTLELKDIKAIIDLMKKNDLAVFKLEKEGFKLELEAHRPPAPLIGCCSVPSSCHCCSGARLFD